MTVFDEISRTCDKLKKVQDDIEYIQYLASTPRSCELSDMPKGGGNAGNPLEQYMIKREKLEYRCKMLTERLEMQWKRAIYQMNAAGLDEQCQKMMYYRFRCNLPWKKCASKLDKKYPNCKWNPNKCFRKYREVLYKIRNAQK